MSNDVPRPEHPRPQLRRDDWRTLDEQPAAFEREE
jgi:hypothetical protein